MWIERKGDGRIVSEMLSSYDATSGDNAVSYTGGSYSNIVVSAKVRIDSGQGTVSVGARARRRADDGDEPGLGVGRHGRRAGSLSPRQRARHRDVVDALINDHVTIVLFTDHRVCAIVNTYAGQNLLLHFGFQFAPLLHPHAQTRPQ